MAKKLLQVEVLKKIEEVHGDKYDLSKVVYVNIRTKIELKCKLHGSFHTSLDQVLRGQGCPECGKKVASKKNRVDFQSFLKEARRIHGSKFDYVETSYSKISATILIKCKVHGLFEQRADAHVRQGQGCPECGKLSQISKRKLSLEEFIAKAKDIHNYSNYDYSKVKYKNNRTKVEILCRKHGAFLSSAYNHLRGSGCPTCGVEEAHEGQVKDVKSFIADSKKVHGSKFDYSFVEYSGGKTKVKIICAKHGPFMQTPNSHQRGIGCPNCNSSKGEDKVKHILKSLNISFKQQYTFNNLIDKGKLKCDFFLPDFNLVIEFNGRQHYEPVNRFGGIKGFSSTQRRDKIKREYFKENNINLLEIHYLEKDIEEMIITILKIE